MTDAVAGGRSARLAMGSALRRHCPSGPRRRTCTGPVADVGQNSSQMPAPPRDRIGCPRPSQWLKSPMTRTPRALGAHTANAVPVTIAVLLHVRAEHLPQVLVPALADQVQVHLAQAWAGTGTGRRR